MKKLKTLELCAGAGGQALGLEQAGIEHVALVAYVLDRNGFTCQMCGAVAGEPHPYDPTRKTRLHIGHIKDKSMGGTDEASNLRAICSICNEGARNLTLDRPSLQKLLIQVRRATISDQREVLGWLLKKFPK